MASPKGSLGLFKTRETQVSNLTVVQLKGNKGMEGQEVIHTSARESCSQQPQFPIG